MPHRPSLVQVATLLLPVLGLAAAAPAQQTERDAASLFKALKRRQDKDLDGRISEEEFSRGARVFRRLDVDGDGFLTLADFEARLGEPAAAGPAAGAPAGSPDGGAAATAATAAQLEFFERRVRPVLADACYSCHSSDAPKLRAGLRVDSRAALLAGGVSGPAVVPGDPDASLFIEAVRHSDPDFSMPPREKLSDEAIADLEHWVRLGAPWPAGAARGELGGASGGALGRDIDLEAGRAFWSFQPVRRPEVPAPAQDDWAWSDSDRFLRHAMEVGGVTPVRDADDRTWLRRVTFDLTGLPPTQAELSAYLGDDSRERDARVVDRLLASHGYAERWGRHWLDVARYAESSGQESNVVYPHAWRYRDWVLRAFDEDLPYDQFLSKQLAGDLEPAEGEDERAWNLIATGYLALGTKNHNNRDARQFQLDVIDEQIDALSQGMLGLTISCARCHDHKFDPLPIEDYYSLAGIFYSSETLFGTHASLGNRRAAGLLELPPTANVPSGPEMTAFVRGLLERNVERLAESTQRREEMAAAGELDADERRRLQRRLRDDQQGLLDGLLSRFDDDGRALASNRLAMGMAEGTPRDIAVLERGELDRPGAVVPRRMPQVLSPPEASPIQAGSGRLELAHWIASPDNPLTARVWVNRLWLHLFGTGLVTTPDNFGAAGQRPSHPELLDWLAAEFVANGWSTKSLLRQLVLSHAYRLDSSGQAANEALDPELTLRWRMPERRLEAEALRDAMLSVAGTLVPEPPVGSQSGTLEGLVREQGLTELVNREAPVRSVYLPSFRGHTANMLEAFDTPDSAFVVGDRDETSVATQALFLMNDADVLRLADAFAQRLLDLPGNDRARVEAAFEFALGRLPSASERKAVLAFLDDYAREAEREKPAVDEPEDPRRNARARRRARQREERRSAALGPTLETRLEPRHAAWSAFAQALFQSAEFRTLG